MKNILTIARGINIFPLLLELQRQPQLWNKNRARTESPTSPHREVDDIWARFGDTAEALQGLPHQSLWMEAADLAPEIKTHSRAVMSLVRGDALGGVLITRIPPGKQVYPHVDPGWHAAEYDKFALQIAAHPQQAFCYEDGQHITAAGDLFWFNNQEKHWVINDSPCERITMIVCVKLDKPYGGV
jgi:quercetin dioxygenase-like cupin family protein